MSIPFELEIEVQPPPRVSQTDFNLGPPINFGRRPTATGGGDFENYLYSGDPEDLASNRLVDHEDLVVEPWKIERLTFNEHLEIIDTITQSPIIRISDRQVKDEI